METFSMLLALCAGNSLVTGEFPSQRPVTRSFDVFIDHLNKRLGKQSWGWWFEMLIIEMLIMLALIMTSSHRNGIDDFGQVEFPDILFYFLWENRLVLQN